MSETGRHIQSPFKFLDAYGKEDRDTFFGREEEAQELYERLFETNLVLLYGPSGTGKTSLIQCGLANLFRSSDWMPLFIRREKDMLLMLREAIARVFPEGQQLENLNTMSLSEAIRQLYLAHFRPVYLIFDQFEELFILGEQGEAERFFLQLRTLLESEVQAKILLSMREEYLAYLSDYEHIVPDLFDNRMRLEKMGRQKLQKVISHTTAHFAIELSDPAVPDLVIDNIRDSRGEVELVNLQIYLDKLYRNGLKHQEKEGREGQPIRFDEALVQQAQKLEDVLSDFLDEQLLLLEQELAEQGMVSKGLPMAVLLALATEDGTKKIRAYFQMREEIQNRKQADPKWIDYCLNRFIELRLIKILGTEEGL